MTIRHFEALFSPRAIALVGASTRAGSVGAVLAANLVEGGFTGDLLFVNPRGGVLEGKPLHRSVAELPTTPDLAVIATPASTVPELIADLGSRGCRAAVVISAGFEGPAADGLRQALLDAARPNLLRIVGPNCLGLLSPAHGINASFARGGPPAGNLALVTQSGAVAAAALDWAPTQGVGFSHVVTLGDSIDVDAADLLDFLGQDPATKAILLYVEGIGDARKFMSAARFAARAKPVVVIKGGRSSAGATAAFSHTGAIAGADAVHEAAFRRAGFLQVDTLEEFFDAAAIFARIPPQPLRQVAVLTNGGGAGVLAVDALEREGLALATLSTETVAALETCAPVQWSRGNPVDILGDAQPRHYADALRTLLAARDNDAVLVLNCPTAVADSDEAAVAVVEAAASHPWRKPVLTSWLGGECVRAGRQRLYAAGLPTFGTPEAAVRAAAIAVRSARLHDLLLEAPDAIDTASAAASAREVVRAALDAGRDALSPMEVARVLRAYGLPSLETRTVGTAAEAGAAAAELGGRVALKILSPDISHKSDVGGVELALGAGDVEAAAERMAARVRRLRPEATQEGFLVQAMADRPRAQEVLAGVIRDPTFGPVVVVGHGGVAVEVLADRALGLPPLNRALARDMIDRTRVSRLLAGYRDRRPANLDQLCDILIALGQLATDLPEIAELDLNPVLCDADGTLILDARIALQPPGTQPAIRPYPGHLAHAVELAGEQLTIRPVLPSDRERLVALVDRTSAQDVRLRFCGAMRHLTPDLATRLSQIDYERHMALAAVDPAGDIVGVGRLVEDSEGETAEFALLVRTDRQNRGLGRLLLREVLDYAKHRRVREVWGDVARENERMLDMARAFGFRSEPNRGDVSRVRVWRRLDQELLADAGCDLR
jgi:acetyltransferase